MAALNLADVQGFILRGYRMPFVRHFVLQIKDVAGSKQFLGSLVNGDATSPIQITTAPPWTGKPDYCLNIGLTYEGLKNLQLSDETLGSFPPEFIAGSAARAAIVGDVGESAPENWVVGGPKKPPPHLLLFLYAQSCDVLESQTTLLRTLFAGQGALSEVSYHDGNALPDGRVHFGYTDGISQPTIDGAPSKEIPDAQPVAPTGEFLLGYHYQFSEQYGILCPNLINWGSTAALRLFVFSGKRWMPSSNFFRGRQLWLG